MFTRICLLLCWATTLFAQQNSNCTLVPAKTNHKWGFIDKAGNVRIAPVFDHVESFNVGGLAVVSFNKQTGVIDSNGREIIPCQYELIKILEDNIIMLRNKGIWELRNSNNQLLISDVGGNVMPIGNGYLVYEKVTGKGLAHINRGKLCEPTFNSFAFTNLARYILVTGNDGKKGLIDSSGTFILPLEFDDLRCDDNFLAAKKDGFWGLFANSGLQIIENEWEEINIINNQFASLGKKGKNNLYAIAAKKMILEDYLSVERFDAEKMLFSKKLGHLGLIDTVGTILVADIYNDIQLFGNNTYRVQSAETQKWGIIALGQAKLVLEMRYDYISALQGSIATITEGGKYGIINGLGEISLQIKYPNLSIENNSVKIKSKDGLLLFSFDEIGNLVEETNFGNFKSLRVALNPNSNNSGTANADPRSRRELNDSLVWMRASNQKFGVYNLNTNKFVLAPEYENYINYPEFNFSIAEKRKREIGGKLSLNYIEASINSCFGLISNQIGKPITKMEFINIEMNDITRDSLPLARCMFVGGKYGLIDQKGRIVLSGMAYIGEFSEGKARCSKVGSLAIDVKNKQTRNLGPAIPYLNRMLFKYEFDGISGIGDPKLLKGVLYCEDAEWGFIDSLGQWVVNGKNAKYHFVESFSNNRAMVCKDKKWGLIDEKGQIVLPLEYDDLNYIPNSDKKLFYISQNQKRYGCINDEAKVVVPVHYEKVRDFSDGLVAVRLGNRWGFVNEKGEEVIKCQYKSVADFKEGLVAVSLKGRWGFIDKTGQLVIKATFSKVGNFSEGLAWVQDAPGHISYIKPNGEKVLEGNFKEACDFEQGLARVSLGEKGWGIIDKTGNWVAKPKAKYSNIEPFNAFGLAKVKIGDKYGLINREGKLVSKELYAQINDFSEGYAVVRPDGYGGMTLLRNVKYGIIDSSGKLICKPKFNQLGAVNEGLAYFVDENGKYGYVNPQGEIVIKAQYFKASEFKAGRAVVYLKYNESGLIDLSGHYVVAPNVNKIMDVSEDLALVKAAYSSYYFLREDLQRHSPSNFQAAHRFHNGVAPVQTSNQWGLVNQQGVQVVTAKYTDIDAFENGYATVKLQNVHGVVNSKGELLIPAAYEYIAYFGNGLFRIEQGNQMGYMDIRGDWVWEMRE